MILMIACSKFCLVTKLNQLEIRYRITLTYIHTVGTQVNYFSIIKVQIEDQVILASESRKGMYIHTSVEKYHQAGIVLHGNWLAFLSKEKNSEYKIRVKISLCYKTL